MSTTTSKLNVPVLEPLPKKIAVFGVLNTRLLAVVGLIFISAVLISNASAATIAVCSDATYTTIQAGINAANPGDTIQVCAGTYDEDVTVNKANLKIVGAGAGSTNVRGPIGGGGSTFVIADSGVEIRNFTITRLGNNTTDWNNPGLNTAGISIQGLSITGALIHDNVLTGLRTGIDINNSNGHIIRNNVIDFNRTGLIFRNQTDNITFVENFVTNNWTVGVLFLDASGGTNSPAQTALNSRFRNNNISANWYGQIVDRQSGGSLPLPGTTNLKNFKGNWFGTTSPVVTTANSAEPGYAAQIPVAYGGSAVPPGGQPDIAGPASANLRYDPVLAVGTDTNVETFPGRGTFGFQGAGATVPVKSSSPGGWAAVSQRTASGNFVGGPATAPFGFGSYRMTTGAGNAGPDLPQTGAGQGGKTWISTQQYDNTLLANIIELEYSTYVTASPASVGNIIAPTLQFQVDLDGNGTRDSAMIFEPYYSTVANGGTQPNVAPGQWQNWDARAGRWWFNNTTVFGCGQCVFPTYDAIISAYPNAKIVTWFALADGYGTQFVAGQNSAGAPWANFDGNIDGFIFRTSPNPTTFDFEPERPSVTINQTSGQADPTSSSPVNFTVTFSEAVTGFDDSDVILSGTAGATTKIVTGGPAIYNVAVSGMTASGTVIAAIADSAAVNAMNVGSAASTSTDSAVTFFMCSSVSIPTNLTALSSTQFLAPINVDDTTGRGILSYDFTLTYNPAVVTPVLVETTGTLSSGWTITTNGSSGTLIVSGFNIAPLSGAGTLLNVRFVASGGIGTSSNLNLTSFAFNEGVPCVNVSNGLVTIISGTISGRITYANAPVTTPVPNTTVNAAGSIPLSTVTDANGDYSLSGFGAGAYTITPSKTNQVNGISNLDATTVAQHVVGFIALNTTQQIAADVTGNGTITSLDAAYIAQFVVNIANPGSTGTWRFILPNHVYPNVLANSTGQDFSAILMGEVTGNWNPAGPLRQSQTIVDKPEKSGQADNLTPIVTVSAPPNQFAATGSNFTVSLTSSDTTNILGPPAETIFGYQFDLLYNQTVIVPQLTPCEITGTISSAQGFFCNTNTPGLIKVVVFGTGAINGAGTLFKFKFTAVGTAGATSPLTIQNFMFNEGVPDDVTTSGMVTLLAPTAAAVSVGGQLLTAAGEPVSKARVVLTATGGTTRTAISNGFGYYQFDGVSVGETYVVSVESKRYTFTPMAISPTDGTNELNLIAQP